MKRRQTVVAFGCNWGSYSALEAAGASRSDYPASIKIMRMSCLGRLDLGLILRAFETGAAGVMLLGCADKDCHYGDGGKSREVFIQARKVLSVLGIDSGRLELVEVPAGAPEIFVKKAASFVRSLAGAKR